MQNQKWSDTMGSYTCIFILGAEPLLNTKNGDMKIKGIEIDTIRIPTAIAYAKWDGIKAAT